MTVIAFVGREKPRLVHRYRVRVQSGVLARSLSACQDKAMRATLAVCSGVDFCPHEATRKTNEISAKKLILLVPPAGFEPATP